MAVYTYIVRDPLGKKTKGQINAVSERSAADYLVSKGFFVTQIKSKETFDGWLEWEMPGSRVAADDFTMFYLQLGNMLDAGLSLIVALKTAQSHLENKKLIRVIGEITRSVEDGTSLSESMDRHPQMFPVLYRSMIRVGEASGNLGKLLSSIASANDAKEELKHQITSALAYPVVLMIASVGVVMFMMMWVIPAFVSVFEKANIPLPLPTRIVVTISDFLKFHWGALFSLIAAAIIGFKLALRLNPVKYKWDQFWLSVPVIGKLEKRIEVTRWGRNFSLMLSSGIPILKALEVSRALTTNAVFEETLRFAPDAVQIGGKLASALERNSVFPSDVIQMVTTGENSGTLDKMLMKVADFYAQLVSRSLRKLTSVIEPIFILLMGGIVGFIMLSILLPIFDMIKILGSK